MPLGNPDLLDGIFDEDAVNRFEPPDADDASSTSTADYEGVAELILRGKTQFANKWIREGEGMFFYDSSIDKLLLVKNKCYFEYQGGGEFQFLRPANTTTAEEDMPIPRENRTCIFLAGFESSDLQIRSNKRVREEEEPKAADTSLTAMITQIENQTGIYMLSNFLKSWNLLSEESTVRYFLKSVDLPMLRFVLDKFAPEKAKPKNALPKFVQSLSKFPQRWRVKTTEFETRMKDVSDDLPWTNESGVSIVRLGDDYYAMLESGGDKTVFVDGIRLNSADGPVGPLQTGSVIAISNVKEFSVPDSMLVVKIDEIPVLEN
jgi:hypothetical protein